MTIELAKIFNLTKWKFMKEVNPYALLLHREFEFAEFVKRQIGLKFHHSFRKWSVAYGK